MLPYCQQVLKRSLRLFVTVARIMVPVMVIVKIAEILGLVALAGQGLGPVMGLLNLPAEAGIVWAATLLTGVFGGLATLATLAGSFDITTAQLSALGAMMLFAHGIPVEQAIVRRAGAGFGVTALLRIGTAVVYGGGVAWFCSSMNLLQTPADLTWLQGQASAQNTPGILPWIQSTLVSLTLTFAIITTLIVMLDAMEKTGFTRLLTRLILPLLKISGLDAKVGPVTTVGVLLGITYGGALIIEEAHKQNLPPRTRFLALSWLSLSHSLIEDTLLILAIGTDIWIILVGRVVLTLIIVALLARLTNRGAWAIRPHEDSSKPAIS